MDEALLKDCFKKVSTDGPNTYPEKAPTDLFNVTENEFIEMGYKYKKRKENVTRDIF